MPEQPSTTHFIVGFEDDHGPVFACAAPSGNGTNEPGRTTCFTCRQSLKFKAARDQRDPILLGQVLSDMGVGEPTPQAAAKNERGFYVIEETIHHGDYRSTRYIEIPQITPLAVDCILQTSAYCYGSWLHPENPDHKAPRNQKLHELVEDLKAGRTNRSVGWSTFRTINPTTT